MRFEYKIVPVPAKGKKAKGLKTPEARFAAALEEVMDGLGAEGWVYVGREEHELVTRKGFLGRKETRRQAYLTFRRDIVDDVPTTSQTAETAATAKEPQTVAPTVAAAQAPVEPPAAEVAETAEPAQPQTDERPAAAQDEGEIAPAAARELADQISVLSKRLEGLTAERAAPNAPLPFRQREQKSVAAAE